MSITRRVFLRNGAMAIAGTATVPAFLASAVGGESLGNRKKRLVIIFQRGAADGLNCVVPHGEPAYYWMRPSIHIPRNAVIDLDGFFGLHPSLSAFEPLWRQRFLAIVHAAGSPHSSRTHFEAQNFLESGTPGVKATVDGWLNRALQSLPGERPAFPAIFSGPTLPRILSGCVPAVAFTHIGDLEVRERNSRFGFMANNFEAMYSQSADSVSHGTGQQIFETAKMLKSTHASTYISAAGASYPQGCFGDSLKQLAQLMKANPDVQAAFADIGGWDHHSDEGGTQGQLANILREFSRSLVAFWTDLGDLAEDTLIVTMSEFGRSARENRNRGTDHGHANVMFVIGGQVRGGKVYGHWPGLDRSQLHEGRGLAVTTDFRRVLGEAVDRQLDSKDLDDVFPGFDNQTGKFLRYLG